MIVLFYVFVSWYKLILETVYLFMNPQLADFLDKQAVKELIDRKSPKAWYLLNFSLWWREYINYDQDRTKIPEINVQHGTNK